MSLTIIPEPCFFEIKDSQTAFDILEGFAFEGDGDERTEKFIQDLVAFFGEVFEVMPDELTRNKISLFVSGKGDAEGYSLRVEKNRISLVGNDEAGLFYALQSLRQLFFGGEGKLPLLEIKDKPRFSSRGFMLDCGRYFFTTEAVKQFLDMMALHKLNEFHWHLSEDQGFRCQLEGKLLLTEIGSYRSNTNFNNKPHGGYYTKSEIKEIVDYAHERYIKVIPEIDSPGHVMAMLASYPSLACFPLDFNVSTFWGVKHDVLCVGKESTFTFMQELFDEIIEMFPDGVIHLGGDEVPTVRWESCPDCRRRMKLEGMTEAKELHTYYLDRMASYLEKKGVEVRMWNDSPKKKKVKKEIAWQLWNGEISREELVREINGGRKFIISCSESYYLDLPYALTSLKKCYNFEPMLSGLTAEGEKNILGVEGCLWTEFVPDMLTADKMTYPRLAAISESGWSPKEKKDYDRFVEKLGSYYDLLISSGVNATALKRANPRPIRKIAGKLYWERRKLCWGAHHNILSDIKAKKAAEDSES